jgi:hypothetical protein
VIKLLPAHKAPCGRPVHRGYPPSGGETTATRRGEVCRTHAVIDMDG